MRRRSVLAGAGAAFLSAGCAGRRVRKETRALRLVRARVEADPKREAAYEHGATDEEIERRLAAIDAEALREAFRRGLHGAGSQSTMPFRLAGPIETGLPEHGTLAARIVSLGVHRVGDWAELRLAVAAALSGPNGRGIHDFTLEVESRGALDLRAYAPSPRVVLVAGPLHATPPLPTFHDLGQSFTGLAHHAGVRVIDRLIDDAG